MDGVLKGKSRDLTWDDLYPIAHELGFAGIELGVHKDYDQTLLWDREGRRRLLDLSRDTGVLTSSVCLHSYWHYSFAHPDPDVRLRAGEIAQQAAEATADMEAKHILIPLTCPEGVEEAAARERWIEGVGTVAHAAESAGVFFCLENVGKPFGNTPQRISEIVDAIASPGVKVYYDPGNAVHSGLDPLQGVELLGNRIGQVHVKEVGGTLLGEGRVPWGEIIEALKQVGFDGWLVLETNPTDDPQKAARKNLEALQKIVG
jgi:hexulose-6-phosphate isomerase